MAKEVIEKDLSKVADLCREVLGKMYTQIWRLGHLPMIFDAKWQNFCVRKIPMPMQVQAQGS